MRERTLRKSANNLRVYFVVACKLRCILKVSSINSQSGRNNNTRDQRTAAAAFA